MKLQRSKSSNSPLNGAIITRRLLMLDISKNKKRDNYDRIWRKTSRNMGIITECGPKTFRGDITSQWCSLWRVIGAESANKFTPIALMVNKRWLLRPMCRPGLVKIHHGWVNLTKHPIWAAVISMQQASVALWIIVYLGCTKSLASSRTRLRICKRRTKLKLKLAGLEIIAILVLSSNRTNR